MEMIIIYIRQYTLARICTAWQLVSGSYWIFNINETAAHDNEPENHLILSPSKLSCDLYKKIDYEKRTGFIVLIGPLWPAVVTIISVE